jgi:hypothetical protein
MWDGRQRQGLRQRWISAAIPRPVAGLRLAPVRSVRRSWTAVSGSNAVLKIILSVSLAALLASCATQTASQAQCTPQYPPGPCTTGPAQVPKK